MKIFLDTANVTIVQRYAYMLDGLTTNPTSLSKEGSDPVKVVRELCSILAGKEVSVEVTENDPKAVLMQARSIAALADNVVVKIPCHEPYFQIIQQLVNEGISINITLVFSLMQGLLMAKMGVLFISPFLGRWNDAGVRNDMLLSQLRTMIDSYGYETQVLAASLRDVDQVQQAIIAGADAATMPPNVLEAALAHPLTLAGIKKFEDDWRKLGVTRFP